LVEVLVIMAVLVVIVALLLPGLAANRRIPQKINCVNNLKQTGIAYRLWEGDNNDKYPMEVSVTNGGAMELVATGNVAACFRVMSNELNTPKILLCPEDTRRVLATNWSTLNNSNISYFVGLDAVESKPQMILGGDDNFAIGGVPVKSGVLQLLTNTPVAWTKDRHPGWGNICLADGSVQQLTMDGLRQALQQTGVATNRLAIP
jgi:prepilin-type processing-associated H-X9-DG protein